MNQSQFDMREQALILLYEQFEQWLGQWNFSCQKGCSSCCSQNVTMTSLEGDYIYRFIRKQNREERFWDTLRSVDIVADPGQTPNKFAESCFNNDEITDPPQPLTKACPFLVNMTCSIYEVRPFNCRCFVSEKKCSPNTPAAAPAFLFTCSTVIMQLIEHLDQKGRWGNMLDILRSLIPEFQGRDLRSRIRSCRPLPGLLIPPEDSDRIQPFLKSILSAQLGDKSLQAVLNGQ